MHLSHQQSDSTMKSWSLLCALVGATWAQATGPTEQGPTEQLVVDPIGHSLTLTPPLRPRRVRAFLANATGVEALGEALDTLDVGLALALPREVPHDSAGAYFVNLHACSQDGCAPPRPLCICVCP